MAKVNHIKTDLQNVATLEDLRRYTALALNGILAQFNGKIDFGDNVRTSGPIAISFVTPNATVSVNHTLGRTPIGYFVSGQDAAGSVLLANQASWTANTVFLTASAAMNAQVMLF